MSQLTFTEQDHSYFCDGVRLPSVTEILQAGGFVDKTWFTEYGRDRGRMIHKATALDDLNDLDEDTLDTILFPYVEAWRAFKRDSGFDIVFIEHPQYHPTYMFAGTPDRTGLLNGKCAVIDIKHVALPWVALQLAAYELLEGLQMKRVAVELRDTGKYSLKEYTDRNDAKVFLSALACYHWKTNNIRRS